MRAFERRVAHAVNWESDAHVRAVPRDPLDVDRTAELAFPLAGPALPFRVPELAPAAQPRCQPAATPDPTEMTLEVPCTAPPPPRSAR